MNHPNILLIMADQLVPQLTGPYGHPVVQTPNLDRLARQGVCFDAAYSPCPVCAPARAAMMTGRHVSAIGAYDNAAPFGCDIPTIPHYLNVAGYDTVLCGKMHFIGPDQLHGFRRRFTTNVYPADFSWVPVRGAEHPSERSHALQYIGDAVKIGEWSQFLSGDEETHFRAIEYLRAKGIERRQENETAPFFLCVSYHHPHEPFWPLQELWDLYEDVEIEVPHFPDNLDDTYSTLDRWLNIYHGVAKAPTLRDPESIRRVRRAYYALVTYVDIKVGQLLAALEANGFADNTIVIFTSDHGDMLCEKGMVQKRTFYEWSSRVPLIIRYGIHAGSRQGVPCSLIDLMPTVLDIAGVSERLPMDGRSLIGILNGQNADDRVVFSEYHSQGSHAPCFMVRQEQYKYVYVHGYDEQLFDLENDPGEWDNLARRLPGIAAQMRAHIWQQFDPDAIETAVAASVQRRWLMRRAMDMTGTRWDVEPRFDPTRPVNEQYLP